MKPIEGKWLEVRTALAQQGYDETDLIIAREMFFLGASAMDELLMSSSTEEVDALGEAIDAELGEFFGAVVDAAETTLAPGTGGPMH